MISLILQASVATLALSAVPLPPPAPWTTVPPMFYSEIVQKADVIVTGTVLRAEARYENGRATIRTYVTLGDLTFHKGRAREQLTLRFEGGQIGEDRLVVVEMPALQVSKRYLLYVDGTAHPEKLSPIVGFHQGAFEVARRDGRDVLLNMDGQELVGVQNDRFVFRAKPAKEPTDRPKAPAIGGYDPTYKPADPNADAIEERMLAEAAERAARARRASPLAELPVDRGAATGTGDAPPAPVGDRVEERDRSLAIPLVLDAQADPGTRLSVVDLLNTTPIERR